MKLLRGPVEEPPAPPQAGPGPALAVLSVAVVVVGVAARFAAPSGLWLDEALSVNIARLPLAEIGDALRRDGSPPLYYLVLHAWTAAFGTSAFATRALSGLAGVLALPLAWLVARRHGPRVAWAAVLLLAANPFAIRYATEARMYAMVIAVVLAGWLALDRVLDGGGRAAQAGVAAATAALTLLHYWSFFLLAVVGALVVLRARSVDPARRDPARRALVAMAAGGLAFLGWLASFLHQLSATGTPWGQPGTLRSLLDTVSLFAGGFDDPAVVAAAGSLLLVLASVFLRRREDGSAVVTTRPRDPGRVLAVVVFGTVALALVAGALQGSAFAIRYAAVVFGPFVVLVAHGTTCLPGRRAGTAAVALLVTLGLWASVDNTRDTRTTAPQVAAELRARARPGDVVAYCPDQLGPSVSRLLGGRDLRQVTFPRRTGPDLVDWTDYAEVHEAASIGAFALFVDRAAGPGADVWLVWSPDYRAVGTRCGRLVGQLELLRPAWVEVGIDTAGYFERPLLVRFPGAGEASS